MNVLTPQSSYIYMYCAEKYIQKKRSDLIFPASLKKTPNEPAIFCLREVQSGTYQSYQTLLRPRVLSSPLLIQ